MDHLVFACIAPHGSITVPLLAGAEASKATHTRLALEELGRRVAEAAPETLVLITPHGHRVDGAFSLLNNRRVRGTLEAEEKGNANSLTLGFRVDQEFNAALRAQASELDVPVARIGYAVPDEEAFSQELDWGALIPLYFLGAQLSPQPQVVIACPDRGNLPGNLPWQLYPAFGEAIRRAAQVTGRRIALIASADMGHAHDPDGPYGLDPASAEFDAEAQEAIREQDLGRLLNFDLDWVQRAATDAFGQILNLHGAIQGTGMRGELLSYEVPTYFGMLCAAYHLQNQAVFHQEAP